MNYIKCRKMLKSMKNSPKSCEDLKNRLEELEDLKKKFRDYIKENITNSASLGRFEVALNIISDKLINLIKEVKNQSEDTRANTEEVTATMQQMLDVIEERTKGIDNILTQIEIIDKSNKNNQDEKQLEQEKQGKVLL
ncbi:hypothetical protein [Defluviitalea phaphyphila]|uniref:hypothetical protein n=1 Tax=Defluviitalea phaphyphila TaxID=1473580 RepID=UPI00072FF1D7|nr:hypothetical protein [Defluviitalea phaphyphila]